MSEISVTFGSECPPGLVDHWIKVERESRQAEKSWIEKLRADGVKAAHPDDGWVNRKENIVSFCYPQFNDGAKSGDRIALGWHWKHRIVVLTDQIPDRYGLGTDDRWHFVETNDEVVAPATGSATPTQSKGFSSGFNLRLAAG